MKRNATVSARIVPIRRDESGTEFMIERPKTRAECRQSDRSHDFANYGMTFEELQEYKARNS